MRDFGIMKDIYFDDIFELYKRVLPCLKIKSRMLKLQGINIDYRKLWEYLSNNKWNNSKNLTLYDIVHDILNVDINKIRKYIEEVE